MADDIQLFSLGPAWLAIPIAVVMVWGLLRLLSPKGKK
jgi:hypothetical protein